MSRADEPVDVAEEVSRFADAVQAWWTSARDGLHADGEHTDGQHEDGHRDRGEQQVDPGHPEHEEHARSRGEHASSCRSCPLCRALDLVRAVRPEVLQQVAAAAETVAVLLREAAEDPDGQPADEPPSPAEDLAPPTSGGAPDADVFNPYVRGTPIVVTDGYEPGRTEHEDEGGRTAWA